MVVSFMMLKAIFLSIENVPFYSTDETETILIFLKWLFLFSHVCKFINNDGTNDLTDNEFDDKEVSKVKNNISKESINKSVYVSLSQPNYTWILFESLINRIYKTKVKIGTNVTIESLSIIVVNDRGKYICGNN